MSLNNTTLSSRLSLVRQSRGAGVTFLTTSVALIAHSLVQTSRNITAPVSRYSLVRQVAPASPVVVGSGWAARAAAPPAAAPPDAGPVGVTATPGATAGATT